MSTTAQQTRQAKTLCERATLAAHLEARKMNRSMRNGSKLDSLKFAKSNADQSSYSLIAVMAACGEI